MPLNTGLFFDRKNVAILAIVGLVLGPVSANLTAAREAEEHAPPKRLTTQANSTGTSTGMSMQMPLVIPLFVENHDFTSKLVLTNAAAQATYADVMLTNVDGREIAQTRVQFPPHSQQSVDIGSLLASAVSRATMGSITIMQAPDFPDTMVILGQLSITYTGSHEPNYIDEEVAMPNAKSSQLLRAVADAGEGSPVVALTNLSMERQHVSVECIAEGGRTFSKSVALKPNETLLSRACLAETTPAESSESFPLSALEPSEKDERGPVGISLKSDGMPGTLAAFGLQAHKRTSDVFYSAITFVDPMMLKSPNTVFDGVAVGSSDVLGGGKFVPELSLTNFSAKKVYVQVTYAQMNRAVPVTGQVADVTLPAGTSRRMTFADLQGDPQLQNSFLVTSNGEAGDILAKLVSRDAHSPERSVELLGKDAQDTNNGGSNPWSIEKGVESTLLLFNHDQEPQIFNVMIASADGTQWNKDFKLAAMETRAISLGELVQKAVKDDKGKTLPKTALSGQISWWTVGTASGPGTGRLLLSSRASDMARSFACGCPYILCGMTFDIIIANLLLGQTITSIDELIPKICLFKSGCSGTTTSNSSSQALSYSWTSQNTAILQISGSSANSTVNGYGASIGTGTMNGTVSAHYQSPSETCTFNGGGNNNVIPNITQDQSLWFFGLSNTPPSGFPGGITATLTASGGGNGTYVWTVTNGTSKVTFENNSSTITKTNVNTVGITSTSYSTAANDVTIQLQFTPTGGSQMTLTYKLSIDSPYKLVLNGSITTTGAQAGASACAIPTGNPSGTNGYQTLVPYAMKSFFGAQITFEDANETFAKQGDIYTPNNWPAYAVNPGFTSTGNFFDNICTVSTGGLNPMPQPPQGGNVGIDYALQAWFVGTLAEGGGVEVWSDTLTRYQDHGTITNTVSPVR